MAQTGYVYVPHPSQVNLEIGLNHNLWGWRPAALDKAGARHAVKALQEGDVLVLGHRGPNSRVKPGGWSDAVLKRVIIAQVTRPYFTDTTQVWADDVYPERIGITVLDDENDIPGAALGPDAMECLRMSANKQGVAVAVQGLAAVTQFATELPATAPDDDSELDHDGELNAVATVLVRREQRKLRRKMFRGASQATCALCGKTLPARLVRAAHIKRRSAATRPEQLTTDNMMFACLLGCDELFEHGFVCVNPQGVIEPGPGSGATDHLRQAVHLLAGRQVGEFTAAKAPFYAWHREHIAKEH